MSEESLLRSEVKKVFEGRLPQLDEVLLWGGRPGVQYCYVSGENLGAFQDIGFDMVKDAQVFSVVGPKGQCSSVVIMGKGTPIPGADPQNGIRVLGVDNNIREITGLDSEAEYDVFSEEATPSEAEASPPPPEAA